MLTGDSATTARAVARALGIDEVIAGVLPAQKAAAIAALQRQGRIVAMAGDGINDAPALAQARRRHRDGNGHGRRDGERGGHAREGRSRRRSCARAVCRARRCANIKQNLFFAFVYNSLGVPIAAGVLYPAFGLLLSPMIAAAAMSL